MEKKSLNKYDAIEVVLNVLSKIVGNNRMTQNDIKELINKNISNNNIRIEIKDFVKILATIEHSGNIRFQINIFDKSTNESENIVSEIVIKELRYYLINKYKNRAKQLLKEKKYRKAYKLLSKVKNLKNNAKNVVLIDEGYLFATEGENEELKKIQKFSKFKLGK